MVDFDGNDQMWTTYDLSGPDFNQWRSLGYVAFGVSRYTGGDSEPRYFLSWIQLADGASW